MLVEKSAASREIGDHFWWALDCVLFGKRPSIAHHRFARRARARLRGLPRFGRSRRSMLVKEGSADCAIAFEPAGQFQAALGGNRCCESNHRLCWRLPIRSEGCRETRWIESNSDRLSNRRD